jgi:transcriptional regulator with XRE-family HTH domain
MNAYLENWELELGLAEPQIFFRKYIKNLRHKAGLTQADLAEALSVDFSSIKHWEYSGILPNFTATLRLLAMELRYLAHQRIEYKDTLWGLLSNSSLLLEKALMVTDTTELKRINEIESFTNCVKAGLDEISNGASIRV